MNDFTSTPKPSQNWYQEEFLMRYRRPRLGLKHVKKLLMMAIPPEIELRDGGEGSTTEIIIRFPTSSAIIPKNIRDIYFRNGVSPEKVFQQVLRSRIRSTDQRTARTQLASIGYNVLRAVWLQILRTRYLDRSDPRANQKLYRNIQKLSLATQLRQGKSPASIVDDNNVKQRYLELLSESRLVHQTLQIIVETTQNTKSVSAKDIRTALWKSVETKLQGTQTAYRVYEGEVFRLLSKQQKGAPVRLQVPSDWTPEQLALALLCREEGKSYQTIEKLVNRVLRNSASISG